MSCQQIKYPDWLKKSIMVGSCRVTIYKTKKKTWENIFQPDLPKGQGRIIRTKAVCNFPISLRPTAYIYKSWTERSEGGRLQKQATCKRHARNMHARPLTHALTKQQRGFFFFFLLSVCITCSVTWKREGKGESKKKLWLFFKIILSSRVCIVWVDFFRLCCWVVRCALCVVRRASCVVRRRAFLVFFFFSIWVFWEAKKVWAMWENTVSRNLRLGRIDVAQAWSFYHLRQFPCMQFPVSSLLCLLRYGENHAGYWFLLFFPFTLSGGGDQRFWRWRIHIQK